MKSNFKHIFLICISIVAYLQILLFMKGFTNEQREKLAIIVGIFLANGFCSAKVLAGIYEEHLVKEGKPQWNDINGSYLK